MATKNWMSRLQDFETAVVGNYNPHEHVIRSSSPSLNFMFGKGHGLPLSLTLAVGGHPKGGKTLIGHMFTGQVHKDYPEGIVAKYDSEYRTEGQSTPEERERIWGIDPNRFVTYETNNPMHIFDHIEKDLAALCQDGMPLKLVIIDSINSIQGRRAMNADTVETQQIGDDAKTLGDGFKRILAVQRKHKFALIFTCQIRAEMDQLEQRRGNKVKMSLPFALQHYAEYFMFVERNRNKDGKQDLAKNDFFDKDLKTIGENSAEQTGHKIIMKMKDSSCGPKGRVGEFTLNYRLGLVNVHEEVFQLAKNRGVFEQSGSFYEFGGQKWNGAQAVLEALAKSPALQTALITELHRRDGSGAFDAADVAAAKTVDAD